MNHSNDRISFSRGNDKRLGQIMLEKKLIDFHQLSLALEVQATRKLNNERHLKLGEILIFTKQVDVQQLRGALSLQVHKAGESRADSLMRFNKSKLPPTKIADNPLEEDSLIKRFVRIFKKN